MLLLWYMHIGETQEVDRNALLVRKYNMGMILDDIIAQTAEQKWMVRKENENKKRLLALSRRTLYGCESRLLSCRDCVRHVSLHA